MNDAPRVVATQEGRVWVGRGDSAYVRGMTNDAIKNYSVFRPLRPLYDPDDVDRRKPIAYEAVYLGTANVTRSGEVAKVRGRQESKQEIGVGDRLLPIEKQTLQSYVPKLPAGPVDGRVISIYDGVRYAGGGQIITLNRGSNEGLTVGDTLQLFRAGQTIEDRTAEPSAVRQAAGRGDRTRLRLPRVPDDLLRADPARNAAGRSRRPRIEPDGRCLTCRACARPRARPIACCVNRCARSTCRKSRSRPCSRPNAQHGCD